MPWTHPTLRQVRTRVRDDVTARIPGADANVPNSNLRVISEANAALAFEEHEFLRWLSRQILPDTAEAEWIERHAAIWLRRGRRVATFAAGVITLAGASGTIVLAGTHLAFGNFQLETTETITLGAGLTSVPVRGLDAGTVGNLEAGTSVRLVQALPGVNATGTVVSMGGGVEEETDEELRTRVIERIQNPPHGGSARDYFAWTMEVEGVTRAWVAPLEQGMGTVTVRFMMDDLRVGDGGFPSEDDIEAVRDYLDRERPVAVRDFFVEAPIAEPIDLTISDLENDTTAVRAAIDARLRVMLARRAAPGQTIYRSWVAEAVATAAGEDRHDLTFSNHAMPSAGHLAVLGTVTYA